MNVKKENKELLILDRNDYDKDVWKVICSIMGLPEYESSKVSVIRANCSSIDAFVEEIASMDVFSKRE